MNCRYCFRQHYPYETEKTLFQEEIAAINADPTLSEIILSGGDPLSLSNNALEMLLMSLSSIPHVKRIRFHTRFPLGIPERIDEEFLSILSRASKQIVFVIHCNHTNECDDDIFKALKSVQRLGIPILSQSVLLRGVNDSLSALKELFETLSNQGIIPYYLHQLDRVQGAAHFEVSEEKGLKLIEELTAQLSGYAVPKYVREVPHLPNKSPVSHSIECLQP
jgi:KamA family protein